MKNKLSNWIFGISVSIIGILLMFKGFIGEGILILILLIPCWLLIEWFFEGYNETPQERIDYSQLYYSNYQKSLRNKDGEASYWGSLYYEDLYKPHSIHQQNQIQLKIQNDILSHS